MGQIRCVPGEFGVDSPLDAWSGCYNFVQCQPLANTKTVGARLAQPGEAKVWPHGRVLESYSRTQVYPIFSTVIKS